jgi:hypothetical protein
MFAPEQVAQLWNAGNKDVLKASTLQRLLLLAVFHMKTITLGMCSALAHL